VKEIDVVPLVAEYAIGYGEKIEDVLSTPYHRFFVFFNYLQERKKNELEGMRGK